ncbi:MAG: recombinase zinc beta ribbon domain-containing protein [Anaerolineae bacterium]|nr:recombinase zinc beta ribbon domain-containing protein [Anaerolineae bacterium]
MRFFHPDDGNIFVQCFAIENREWNSGNTKYHYLMGKRCTCGCCGYKMTSCTKSNSSGRYMYYRCPTNSRHDYYRACNLPNFRIDRVDEVMWNWVVSLLSDRTVLRKKLMAYKTQAHEITQPIREQLHITENLIKEKEQELQGELANLRSVNSQRAKAVIAHDIEQIERAIDGVELQKEELTKRLNIQMPSDEQIQDIETLAADLAADLDEISQDFESRRRLVEMLNVRATLKVEDGQKVVYAECILGSESLLIACKNAYVDVN